MTANIASPVIRFLSRIDKSERPTKIAHKWFSLVNVINNTDIIIFRPLLQSIHS